MKKQIKKLNLSKRTISNLQPSEMKNKVGASREYCSYHGCGGPSRNCTRNQNTCPGRDTCYAC
jgi:hypothetical protein